MRFGKTILLLGVILLGLTCPSSAQVGKEALTQFGRFLARGRKIHNIPVGNYKIKMPPAVSRVCIKESVEGYFADGRLNPKTYPALSAKNDVRMFEALQHFTKSAVKFEENYADILSRINATVEEKIDYKKLLPKDVGIIYLGEIHNQPRIHQEIISLLKQLPSIYPERRIYLATEFLHVNQAQSVQMNLIFTPAELRSWQEKFGPSTGEEVMLAALRNKMGLLGVEDRFVLLEASAPKGELAPTEEQYGDFATSFEGMKFRNKMFAQKLKELRTLDPDALVVFYGGVAHVSYSELNSLPSLLREKSFVIQYAVPPALIAINPLFSYMRHEPELRDAFRSSENAKLVERWRKPTQEYRRILGSDLSIIVHE